MMVADAFEKIRINPGNFADGRKTFEVINYEDPAQFKKEQEEIREVCWATLHHEGLGFNPWLVIIEAL
jgi:4-hydroxy-3-methylbut-2-en-1-yl diphosphate synthase IspG/GcpE